MLKMSRMTDYGTVVLAHLAAHPDTVFSASEIAAETRLSPPSVSKLLKHMSRAGLVSSFRGASGGYTLARPAEAISAAQVLDALEGPVALTECSADDSQCQLEDVCGVGRSWQRINRGIRQALEHISLAELIGGDMPEFDLRGGDSHGAHTATARN